MSQLLEEETDAERCHVTAEAGVMAPLGALDIGALHVGALH